MKETHPLPRGGTDLMHRVAFAFGIWPNSVMSSEPAAALPHSVR